MERFENLLDFINELNENGRIQYDDYSRLFDLVQEFAGAEEAIRRRDRYCRPAVAERQLRIL